MLKLSLPASIPAGIAVFQLDLDLDGSVHAADSAVLSEDEHARALRYRQPADRLRFVSTRASLRHLLAQHMHSEARDVRFHTNQYGKPSLICSKPAPLHFNVSHAGQYALIALSEHCMVGIDIEYRNPDTDVASLAAHIFSPLEKRSAASERLDFFEHWSAKEAALKALGLGIGEHLQDLSVFKPSAAKPGLESHCRVHWASRELPAPGVCHLRAPAGYAAALAWVAA